MPSPPHGSSERKPGELKVFLSHRASVCGECREGLGRKSRSRPARSTPDACRSAAARRLDDEAVRLAVVAHVRHRETPYDRLLADGEDRQVARARVRREVEAVLESWGRAGP